MAGSGQSGQQQTNAQAYMPMMQGQGYPMYGMYSQQYGCVSYVFMKPYYWLIAFCIYFYGEICIDI